MLNNKILFLVVFAMSLFLMSFKDIIIAQITPPTKTVYETDLEQFIIKTKDMYYDSYLTGKSIEMQSIYLNMTYDGKLAVINETINQTNLREFPYGYSYWAITTLYKDKCVEFFSTDSINTTMCPGDNMNEKLLQFAREETTKKTFDENVTTSYGFYLLFDYLPGNLESLTIDLYPSESDLYSHLSSENIKSYLNTTDLIETLTYTIKGEGKCLAFPLNRMSSMNVNITMPSEITSYSLGNEPKIIAKEIVDKNKLEFEVIPYLCCGVEKMALQWVEVCI